MAGLKEFFEKLESDTGLQEKVKAAEGENALLKVITDAGYDVKSEEWKKFSEKTAKEGELSDDDLDNVSGGEVDKLLTIQIAQIYYMHGDDQRYTKLKLSSYAESIDWDLLDACGVPYREILGEEALKKLGVWRDDWGAV